MLFMHRALHRYIYHGYGFCTPHPLQVWFTKLWISPGEAPNCVPMQAHGLEVFHLTNEACTSIDVWCGYPRCHYQWSNAITTLIVIVINVIIARLPLIAIVMSLSLLTLAAVAVIAVLVLALQLSLSLQHCSHCCDYHCPACCAFCYLL
jgi:hypothetical protein